MREESASRRCVSDLLVSRDREWVNCEVAVGAAAVRDCWPTTMERALKLVSVALLAFGLVLPTFSFAFLKSAAFSFFRLAYLEIRILSTPSIELQQTKTQRVRMNGIDQNCDGELLARLDPVPPTPAAEIRGVECRRSRTRRPLNQYILSCLVVVNDL